MNVPNCFVVNRNLPLICITCYRKPGLRRRLATPLRQSIATSVSEGIRGAPSASAQLHQRRGQRSPSRAGCQLTKGYYGIFVDAAVNFRTSLGLSTDALVTVPNRNGVACRLLRPGFLDKGMQIRGRLQFTRKQFETFVSSTLAHLHKPGFLRAADTRRSRGMRTPPPLPCPWIFT